MNFFASGDLTDLLNQGHRYFSAPSHALLDSDIFRPDWTDITGRADSDVVKIHKDNASVCRIVEVLSYRASVPGNPSRIVGKLNVTYAICQIPVYPPFPYAIIICSGVHLYVDFVTMPKAIARGTAHDAVPCIGRRSRLRNAVILRISSGCSAMVAPVKMRVISRIFLVEINQFGIEIRTIKCEPHRIAHVKSHPQFRNWSPRQNNPTTVIARTIAHCMTETLSAATCGHVSDRSNLLLNCSW